MTRIPTHDTEGTAAHASPKALEPVSETAGPREDGGPLAGLPDPAAFLAQVRAPSRLRASQVMASLVDDFRPVETPDKALRAGLGHLDDTQVLLIGQCKPTGRSAAAGAACNFGMMTATGYWWVVDRLRWAAQRKHGIITLIDTPGADPTGRSVEDMLAWAVSASIARLLDYPYPVVSLIIGEGGSGGALALQPADVRLMLSDSMYSVIAPESCSMILQHDTDHVSEALALLRPHAASTIHTGIIDRIVQIPAVAAIDDHAEATRIIAEAISQAFSEAKRIPHAGRRARRAQLYFGCGAIALGRSAHSDAMAPVSPPDSQHTPTRRRLVEIGGEGLQAAYYSVTGDDALLCAKNQGGCGAVTSTDEVEAAGWSCPLCGRSERLGARQWIDLLTDSGSFEELARDLDLGDLHHASYDTPAYRELRAELRARLGVGESLVTGTARIGGIDVAVAVSEFAFMGGTLGAVAGEKLRLLCDIARGERVPLITVTSSGGVRMQEGTLGLAQMAKTNAAIQTLTAAGLAHVSILADPCTGGALGSYATYATTVLAEPHALVAFAGPRVLRGAGLPVEENKLDASYLSQFEGIDEVVHRRRMRSRIRRYIGMVKRSVPLTSGGPTKKEAVVKARELVSDFLAEFNSLIERSRKGEAQDRDVDLATLIEEVVDLALLSIPEAIRHTLDHQDPRVRANAVHGLGQFSARQHAELHRCLRDPNNRVRANAAAVLLADDPSHEAALTCVSELLDSSNPVWRRSGLFVATRIPLHVLRARTLASLEDPDPLVRLSAAIACFTQGCSNEGEPMLRRLGGILGTSHVRTAVTRLRPFAPPDIATALGEMLKKEKTNGGAP